MKRWRWLGLLGMLIAAPLHAASWATNDWTIFDLIDPTKLIRWQLSGMPAGTDATLIMPDYGGGVLPLPIDQGTSGYLLVSQGAGFNPGWQSLGTVGLVSGSLTADRVAFAQSTSVLIDDADMKFKVDSLTITRINCPKTLRLGGSNATTSIPFVLSAAASQASDLCQWLDSGGVMRNRVDAGGGLNYAKVNATAQSADITTTNFATSMQAGQYLVELYIEDTVTDVTAGIVTATIAWTDDVGATSDATLTQDLTGLAVRRNTLTRTIYLASGNITYATSHSGVFGSATYALRARLTYQGQ